MRSPRRDLPSGSVTFLFTDIEGSTRLLEELGEQRYERALADHRDTIRDAFNRHEGAEVDTQGDAFFYAFADAQEAVVAAMEAQASLAEGPIRVRMGLHTGEPRLTAEGYVGREVHRGARIAAAGHGGQVLLSKATRDLVDLEITDLGEHRVKDFAEPVSIFQLGTKRFPPLKTISNTNLPHPASSFVGREREVRDVASMLTDGARLVTLTGPGGSGKTRLAIEAAAELVPEFKAGVFWVGLAALRDSALVTDTVAHTLGAQDGLADHVGERQMLLLLDNLEQVIDAAPELAALAESCPNLKLLVTSRELLRVRGEVEYSVPPLADPEAVHLFCARSGMQADETIAELCRRLDNLPLAVELAAARTSVLSPVQILERLTQRLDLLKGGRDAEARQRTLRSTIEWSFELLDENEKRLFARLAVFAGGATLDAAESVADADLDTLQSLVAKSLIRHTEDRFWMLETIREYATERLAGSGEAEHRHNRHAEYFMTLAEEAQPRTREFRNDKTWLDRLEAEQANFRAALDWLAASGQSQLVLQLAGALTEFWGMRGFVSEGGRLLERALAVDDRPTAARARALNGVADLGGLGRGDDTAARRWAEDALKLHRELGDDWGAAEALFILAHAAADQGEYEAARDFAEESRQLFERAGDEEYETASQWMLGWAWGGLGDAVQSRELYEAALRRARSSGAETLLSLVLYSLSGLALDERRPADAIPILTEASALDRNRGDRWRLALTTCRLGSVLAALGRWVAAAQVLSAGKASLEEMGGSASHRSAEDEATIARLRADLGEPAFSEAWDRGRSLTLGEAVELGLAAQDQGT